MKKIRILGTGSYVPPKVLTNEDLKNMGLDTSDEWIVQRTGIKERRLAGQHEATSDLALEASKKALDMAGLSPDDIDLIIVGTITPDTHCPAAANWLQAKLNAKRAVNFDITAACSGFIYAMHTASQFIHAGSVKKALVIGAEVMSRVVNWKDRTTCILWGDGAGAAILTADNKGHQLLSTHVHTDGENGKDLLVPGGGSTVTPITKESVERGDHYLNMIGANASFRVAVRHFLDSIMESVEHNKVTIEDINWFIPHQANFRMFTSIAKSIEVPIERFYITLDRYGNSSSASCAIALDEAVRDGSIKEKNHVCMPVFGGGLTWGSALIKW
ncbi:MAG: ketoacyl-ACP synthase III [Deltaproteobacteria bacterium]|nr:ketoacyl-ACP synthase III [Deltaproteobacteria bacterium]